MLYYNNDWRNCGHAGIVRTGHWITLAIGFIVGLMTGVWLW
jgi:hypothetical protein